MTKITVTVDGVTYVDDVEPRLLLVHYLRDRIGKTGTPVGCDTSNCGACTVHLDGISVKSCSVLAVQADGSEITTIEGLSNGEWHPLQQAFHSEHALQCGYCTPGMIMAAADLLRENPRPQRPGDPRGAGGQPLPLHRIREHRPCRPARLRSRGEVTMTADMQAPPVTELGRARLRKEDARLMTGKTNWTDNIVLPGMLHVAFVRSPFAHARITPVDVGGALRMPGVIAAFSGADFADEQGSLPCAWPVTPDIVIPAHPPMATDEVRYVGEAVACVVARDRYDRRRRAVRGGRGLRAAAGRPGHPDRAGRVLAEGARGGQQELRVPAAERRPGRGVPRRAGGDRAHLPAAAADPERDGAARGGRLE